MARGAASAGAGKRIALPGVLSALALLFLYLSALAPTGRWAMVAIAGLFPASAVVSAGLTSGLLTYGVSAVLGFFLVPDKGMILLYALFFGLYPLLKSLIERLHKLPLELLGKLVFFNAVLTLFLFVFSALFLAALPQFLQGHSKIIIYVLCNIVFLVYDLGLTKLIGFYCQRIDKAVRR